MNIHTRLVVFVLILASGVVSQCIAADKPNVKPKGKPAVVKGSSSEPLGSVEFAPSPERTIGWRGDGTGRYPAATPPIAWERKQEGANFTTTGVVWSQPLPATGVSSPIIVGDRIFVTGEVADLICLDKKTGHLLWIRSNPEFEALSDEDRAAYPDIAIKLAPLSAELAQANSEAITALNARLFKTVANRQNDPAFKHKRDVEKKIQDELAALDKKKFGRYWGQAVFGFAGQTPTSDGKNVCAFFTTGVSVCYDLDGNRKWIAPGKGGGSEHGNFASPLLCGNRLIVWANELRGYDVETGKLLWTNPAKASNTYGSMFQFQSGGELVAGFQWGNFARVSDGKPVWEQGIFGDSVTTPIVEGETIFAHTGYPKNNKGGMKAFKIPATTESGKLEALYTFKEDWADDELPIDKKVNPFDRNYVASPLYVDGLIYQMTQGGGLLVSDAATGEVVYRKVLPLKPRTSYWNWAGASTSPTLAGKYIYLMDNQGTTLIIKPGKTYEQVAQNTLVELRDGKEQEQFLATPIFEGSRMYYRTPGFLYAIGDK